MSGLVFWSIGALTSLVTGTILASLSSEFSILSVFTLSLCTFGGWIIGNAIGNQYNN